MSKEDLNQKGGDSISQSSSDSKNEDLPSRNQAAVIFEHGAKPIKGGQ